MKIVLPVIHHIDKDTTWEQAEIAYKCGADGIFLISHFNEDLDLPPIAKEISQENWKTPSGKEFKLGLNLLNTHHLNSFDIVKDYDLDYLWLDHAGINSSGISESGKILVQKYSQHPKIDIFASVAFKYQATDPNPPLAAQIADSFGFIATTSGAGTGSAPSVDKIQSMNVTASGRLAVASGMTVENIKNFIPYLSHILVATGVSIDEHRFNNKKLKQFIDICHNY